MAKRVTSYTLMLPPREPRIPAYRWLYSALRAEILDGRLRPGARLPGTRDLASQYRLSRGTIVNAFAQLASEGYVEGSVGAGTYVSRVLPDDLLQVRRKAQAAPRAQGKQPRKLSGYGRRVKPFPGLEPRRTRAFRANLPALRMFPARLWAQVAARRFRRAATTLFLGCEPLGYRPLREAIADYLGTSRGVKCAPEQVAIVSGIQEALDLVARLFLDPGDPVAIEDPGYPGAALVFEALGARISALPVDEQGIDTGSALLRGARLVYVTPAHQFPLGVTMSLPRRLELLEWARSSSALIFEDDYDSEYRYTGRPVPALQGLDRTGCVLFAGSFSKVLFPSLRIGYLVIPGDLLDSFAAMKSLTNRHLPLIEQAVLCDFIAEGHFGRHLRRMREVYGERLAELLTAARRDLAGLLEISSVEAGLQTAGWLSAGIDAESVARAAAAKEVEVTPLSRYARVRMAREGLQLGFAAVDLGEIRRGVHALAAALQEESKAASKRVSRRLWRGGTSSDLHSDSRPGRGPAGPAGAPSGGAGLASNGGGRRTKAPR